MKYVEMDHMKRQLKDKFHDLVMLRLLNWLDKYEPIFQNQKMGRNFFKPDDHAAHMEGMEITAKKLSEHMIPHHQVATEMRKDFNVYK